MFDVTTERLGRRLQGTRSDDAAIRRVAARFSALVILGGYGGLRFGELAGLRRNRIDTARRVVRVDSTLTEVRGQLIPGRPKTAAGVRSVPLPRTVTATLELAVRGLDDGRVRVHRMPTAHQSEPARSGHASGSRRPTAADLVGLRMHDLRHTAVSLWIAHGASAKQVQVWAGHRSVATVFDRYGHLFPGGEDPVMDSLDAAASLARLAERCRRIRTREIARDRAAPPESRPGGRKRRDPCRCRGLVAVSMVGVHRLELWTSAV